MSSRYEDKDYDRYDRDYGRREEERYGQNYGYGRSGYSGEDFQREYGGGYRLGRNIDRERFDRETDFEREDRERPYSRRYRSDYGQTRNIDRRDETEFRPRGERTGYKPEFDNAYRGESLYGTGSAFGGRLSDNPYEEGYDYDRTRYGEPSRGYSPRYNYPRGFRSGETYDRTYDRGADYDRGYDRQRGERDWFDRASDTVASWFGDENAEQRRRMDKRNEPNYRGRGPRGYKRSDERIKEDVNDRLSDDPILDASDVEVAVTNCEVVLTGKVDDRRAKRRAEDLVEHVSGVRNVENRLRLREEEPSKISSVGSSESPKTAAAGASSGTTTTPGRTT